MTHIVNDKCYKCKYTDCVEVCPVDCFHEGEDVLVIDPDVCIDCGICVIECPVEAIVNNDTYIEGKSIEQILLLGEKEEISPEQQKIKKLFQFNNVYSKIWPKITKKKDKHLEEGIFSKIDDKIKYIDDIFNKG